MASGPATPASRAQQPILHAAPNANKPGVRFAPRRSQPIFAAISCLHKPTIPNLHGHCGQQCQLLKHATDGGQFYLASVQHNRIGAVWGRQLLPAPSSKHFPNVSAVPASCFLLCNSNSVRPSVPAACHSKYFPDVSSISARRLPCCDPSRLCPRVLAARRLQLVEQPPPPRGSWNARPNRRAPPRPGHGRHDPPTPTQHVATQEAAARAVIVAAEGAAIQEVLLQKYRSALVAASTAHRQLALGPATSESEPQRHWSDAEYTTLLTENFDASQQPTGILGSGALPPSLAAPAPHHSSPASDAGRGHTDLRLDEERYSNFRRHFRESPSPEPLDTPPPCWSPARLTPSLSGARGPPSSTSPGLTPSPAVWSSAQRSPGPVSALAFADWTPTQAFAPGTTFGTAAPEGQE
eukprot:TRINITY_DN4870_c0_g1_i1.p2 TRINITY_DN4870_c0_g1~~TRINITY_DN4870_c0_g1_i1.p2  ORF type:complete len:409 (+),score=3.44 TRINITY_DN4870_c0_g1_i1:432-1658(+)